MSVVIDGTTGIDTPGITFDGQQFDVQEFTSSGTWTKPANAKLVYVEIWGGGGGGGSGRRGAAGSNRIGGAGGSGSYPFIGSFRADELTSTVSVTIGAGGAGGAAVTVNDTSGSNGASGGSSSFGSYVTVTGGSFGSGTSQATIPVPYAAPSQQFGPNIAIDAGGVSSNVGAGGGSVTGTLPYGGRGGYGFPLGSKGTSGGGGGGCILSSNVAYNAGLGGSYFTFPTDTVGGVLGNGVGAGVNGAAGSAFGVGGGGGGPGSAANAGNGGAGGTAAGGGGGGASLNGFNSGAGGAGGNGFCRVTTYF